MVAGGRVGLEIKDNATYANVGMGSAPSASSNYPVLIQRSNVSTGTYFQINNPDTAASSKATFQLSTDNGLNLGEISIFTAAVILTVTFSQPIFMMKILSIPASQPLGLHLGLSFLVFMSMLPRTYSQDNSEFFSCGVNSSTPVASNDLPESYLY